MFKGHPLKLSMNFNHVVLPLCNNDLGWDIWRRFTLKWEWTDVMILLRTQAHE